MELLSYYRNKCDGFERERREWQEQAEQLRLTIERAQ